MNPGTPKPPPVRPGRTGIRTSHAGKTLAALWRNIGADPTALQEDSSCADFAARLARMRSAYEQQAQVAEAIGRPDLAASYRARAITDQSDLLSEWLSHRQPGHLSPAAIRAAALAEGRSRYSSRGRRIRRAADSEGWPTGLAAHQPDRT